MAAFAIGEGWQIHDAAGRRKYLSTDERTRFLRAADSLSPRRRALMSRAGLCRLPHLIGSGAPRAPHRRRAIHGDHQDAKASQAGLPRRARPASDDRAPQKATGRRRQSILVDASRHGLACHQGDDAPRRHRRSYGLPQRFAPRLRYSRRRPQRPHEPDSALDGPCLAGHDRYLPRRHRARGTAVCQPHVVIDSGCGQSFSKSNALSLTNNAALDRLARRGRLGCRGRSDQPSGRRPARPRCRGQTMYYLICDR
jgi:hypothetical protein